MTTKALYHLEEYFTRTFWPFVQLREKVDQYSFTRWAIHVPLLNYECMHCMHAAAMFLIHDTCMQISINIPFIYKYYFMHVMCMHAGQAHCMHPKCMLIKTTEMF